MAIPEGGFSEFSSIASWIALVSSNKARFFVQAIASRVSIRILPNIEYVFKNAVETPEWENELVKDIFWAGAFSRHKIVRSKLITDSEYWSGSEAIYQRLTPIDAIIHGNAKRTAFSIANAVISDEFFALDDMIVSLKKTMEFSLTASNVFITTQQSGQSIFSKSKSLIAQKCIWAAVTADARALEAGATLEEMAARPLWPENSPYKPQFDRKTFLAAAPSFEVWLDWYEPIVDGKAPWGLPREIANKLEERIALGDGRGEGGKDFWERDADVVNAEIKGWVEEEKGNWRQREQKPKSQKQTQLRLEPFGTVKSLKTTHSLISIWPKPNFRHCWQHLRLSCQP